MAKHAAHSPLTTTSASCFDASPSYHQNRIVTICISPGYRVPRCLSNPATSACPQNPTWPAKHPPLQALVHNPFSLEATTASCHHAFFIIMQKASSSVGTSVSLLTPIGELFAPNDWPAIEHVLAAHTAHLFDLTSSGFPVWEGVGVICWMLPCHANTRRC